MAKTMEEIVAHCKNTGFIFPGSEIYGGLANSGGKNLFKKERILLE